MSIVSRENTYFAGICILLNGAVMLYWLLNLFHISLNQGKTFPSAMGLVYFPVLMLNICILQITKKIFLSLRAKSYIPSFKLTDIANSLLIISRSKNGQLRGKKLTCMLTHTHTIDLYTQSLSALLHRGRWGPEVYASVGPSAVTACRHQTGSGSG